MPKYTPHFGLPCPTPMECTNEELDFKRFHIIDQSIAFLSDLIGDGKIEGWNIKDNGNVVTISAGSGLIGKRIFSTYGEIKKSFSQNGTYYLHAKPRKITTIFSMFSNVAVVDITVSTEKVLEEVKIYNPSYVSAKASSEKVTVSWSYNHENPHFFKIYRSVGPKLNFVLLSKIEGNLRSFDDYEIESETLYTYYVAAVCGDKETPTKKTGFNVSSATTLKNIHKKLTLTISESILHWEKDKSVFDGYEIWKSIDNEPFALWKSVDANATSIEDVFEQRKQSYLIRKFNNECVFSISNYAECSENDICIGKVIVADGKLTIDQSVCNDIFQFGKSAKDHSTKAILDHDHSYSNLSENRIRLSEKEFSEVLKTYDGKTFFFNTVGDILAVYVNGIRSFLPYKIEDNSIIFYQSLGMQSTVELIFHNICEVEGLLSADRIESIKAESIRTGKFSEKMIPQFSHLKANDRGLLSHEEIDQAIDEANIGTSLVNIFCANVFSLMKSPNQIELKAKETVKSQKLANSAEKKIEISYPLSVVEYGDSVWVGGMEGCLSINLVHNDNLKTNLVDGSLGLPTYDLYVKEDTLYILTEHTLFILYPQNTKRLTVPPNPRKIVVFKETLVVSTTDGVYIYNVIHQKWEKKHALNNAILAITDDACFAAGETQIVDGPSSISVTHNLLNWKPKITTNGKIIGFCVLENEHIVATTEGIYTDKKSLFSNNPALAQISKEIANDIVVCDGKLLLTMKDRVKWHKGDVITEGNFHKTRMICDKLWKFSHNKAFVENKEIVLEL